VNIAPCYRATIPPLAESAARPLWSVMIPTYNSGAYLHEALGSVLAQDPGPGIMQIEVVDDASTIGDPQAVVAALGGERVGFFRQRGNVGHVENFATCLRRARGRLIHLLHGDDIVRQGFYRTMEKPFLADADIGAAFCRHIFMDEDGQWLGISPLERRASGRLRNRLEHLASEQRIMTPSMVVRREVYENLGGFDARLICSEDWEMWVRIAARYPIWYEIEPLACYRMHENSNTGRHLRTAQELAYTRQAIDTFKAYLPQEIAERVSRHAKRTYAVAALETACGWALGGDFAAARRQISAALRCSHSPAVWRSLVRQLARFAAARWIAPARRSTGVFEEGG
jgi:glycosyltransferase involved in cell wall biosynthesis